MFSWLMALAAALSLGWVAQFVWLGPAPTPLQYFYAISLVMLPTLLMSVVLAVWRRRPAAGAGLALLAGSLNALLFFSEELSAAGAGPAVLIIGSVALTVWLMARLGCRLQQRFWSED
jgi:hypothetical protein